ncbi:MAG: diguanylate cyclase, partial [Holophagales bacterium]|nr:diguanylate cyclase [Holophagales bacterium]
TSGYRFDINETVDDIKNILKAEINIWFNDTNIVTTLMHEGSRATGLTLDPLVNKIVMQDGKEFNGEVTVLGRGRRFFCMPFHDPAGEVFAAINIGNPLEELRQASNSLVASIFFISFVGLVIAAMLMYFLISMIIKSIIMLAKNMEEVAQGNLDVEIGVESKDEIGILATSIKRVITVIQKLMVDINIMIHEHAKGNSDYNLETEELQGDYKKLANNILELADEGMKDRLTKLPNRLTFDNRLKLEWDRAMRERKLLSALMMDLDKFKTYNDTFGHQQGDVALKTAAEVFKRSVRKNDFVARWGGEEFIALLPSTDSVGAMAVAENIRAAIENMLVPCSDQRASKITVSIGVNTQMPTHLSSPDYLLSKADEALYKAKQSGRNRAVFWG